MVTKLTNIYICDTETHKIYGEADENALFFVTDIGTNSKTIYRGNTRIGGDFIIVNGGIPEEIEQGVVYYISEFIKDDDASNPYPFVGFFDGVKWIDFHKDYNNKQDKLTPGKGIEISDDNIISTNIDLSLYKIVSELPTQDIDNDKIYLVINTTSETENKYIEYIHHTDGWEKLGEYKADIPLDDYLKKEDAEKKYISKNNGSSSSSQISISTNGSFNNYGNNGQAFNAVRDLTGTTKYQQPTGSGYPLNAASFGVKDNGTTAFSHKKYTTFNKDTGAATGAKNTAVLVFSGNSGLLYAKNTGSASDVTEEMYKYVGVIDSPDEKQKVYSAKQVDDLIKGLTDTIAALEARVKALEEK